MSSRFGHKAWLWLGFAATAFLIFTSQAQTSSFQLTRIVPVPSGTIAPDSGLVIVKWTGGIGPFQVQCCDGFNSQWQDVAGITYGSSQTNIMNSPMSFFRVLDLSSVKSKLTDQTPPSVPTGLAAAATSSTQVNLTWNASTDSGSHASGVNSYNVCRNGFFLEQVAAPSTSAADTGLIPGTTYTYTVSAVDNAYNESAQSAPVSVTTPPSGGCAYVVSPMNPAFAWTGGSGNLAVTAGSTCGWTAYGGAAWITITSGASGVGNGSVGFSVAANTSTSTRTGTLTVAGQTVTVSQSSHTIPVANAGPSQSTSVGSVVTFNGSGTAFDGATITSYNWLFGDSTSASGAAASHTYTNAGTYTVTFTVTDSFGASASATTTATITNIGVALLSVSLTSPSNAAIVSNTITLAAAATNAARVVFYCDGNSIGTNTSGPPTSSWNTTTVANGSHSLYATAYGTNGSATNSATITVTVANTTSLAGGTLVWLQTNLPPYMAQVNAVAIDHSGNVIAVGYFAGNVDFGGGLITGYGYYDAFVARYSPQGALLWVKDVGGVGYDAANGVSIDSSNNIIVVGTFQGSATLGGGTVTAKGGSLDQDAFVVKYSPSGSYIWGTTFGSLGPDIATAVAVDGSNNELVTAEVSVNCNFGNGIALPGHGGYDVGLVKFAGATGATLWAQDYGGPYNDVGHGIAVDGNGDVLVTGSLGASGSLGGIPLSGSASSGAFMAKYSGVDGSYEWSRIFSAGTGYGITIDSSTSNVFVSGGFSGSVDFGGGPITTQLGQNGGIFLAGYDSSGNYLWAKSYGQNGDAGYGVAADGQGHLALTGTETGLVDFSGTGVYTAGNFLMNFTVSGNAAPIFQWAKSVAANGTGVAFDSLGHVLAGGWFKGTAYFDGISVTTSSGGQSSFVAQYAK